MKIFSSQLTAIIADDEPSILRGIHDAIDWKALGITVIALAHNGLQALNLISEHKPDIAIIDIKMPEMNGLEVIERANEAQCDTDFIILSGYGDFRYTKEAIRRGARAFLLKPANIDELYSELHRIAGERNSRRNYIRQSQSTPPAPQDSNVVFFNNLIDNRVMNTVDINTVLTASHINLDDSPCHVMVVLFEPDQMPIHALLSLLNGVFPDTKHNFWQYGPDKIIGILNSTDTRPEGLAEKCLKAIDEAGLPLPLIGIGDTVAGLFQCSYSYNRALTALSYRIYDNDGLIFSPKIICKEIPKLRFEDIDYLPLIRHIERNDICSIHQYCSEFIDKLLYVEMPPPNYLLSLCSALIRSVERASAVFQNVDLSALTQSNELYKQRSLSEIRVWLTNTFCSVSNSIAPRSGPSENDSSTDLDLAEQEDPIVKEAHLYIQNHITANIKLEDIARQVHLSPAYFATYFKNKTGTNLRDYLLIKKMEYAKERLSHPHASVNDVAVALGYSDYRSFSRAFKNLFGITPSDYQSNTDTDKRQ